MENASVFSSISHEMEKDSQTHRLGKAEGNWFPVIFYKTHYMWRIWEIDTHTFPIGWVLFSIRFPSYGILPQMGNAWAFSSNFL